MARARGGRLRRSGRGGRKSVPHRFRPRSRAAGDNFERKTATGTERVLCLDEGTGKEIWKHQYPVTYTISYPAGPRCTPTVHGDRVYTLGAEGNLLCLSVADGRVIWQRDLKQDYDTKAALWGWAGHPLVDGNRLLVVAGTAEAHVVALDTLTGKELWRAGTAPEQGYSPPTIIDAAGVRQLVLMKPDGMYAVAPETGKPLWETPYNADNGSIIMAPMKVGEHLYVGGFHEKGDLRAVQIPSGEVKWSSPGPFGDRAPPTATAFITRHGDRYFLFAETGHLVIARLSPQGYEEIDRTHLLDTTQSAFGRGVVWSAPAYADRSVFLRNDKELIRVSLAQ